MINGSKISVHRFIATTLFRMIEGWPHSSGNNDWPLIYKHWQLKAKLRLLWDKNFKAVAMRYKNQGKSKDVTKDCLILEKILE